MPVREGASQVAQWQRARLPMQEKQAQSLGGGDSLQEAMATCSRTPAWKIPWTEEAGGLQTMESQSLTQLSDKHPYTPVRETVRVQDLYYSPSLQKKKEHTTDLGSQVYAHYLSDMQMKCSLLLIWHFSSLTMEQPH